MAYMARDLQTMFRDALELSEGDRATLAGLLIESLEPPPDPDVEELWSAEAERLRSGQAPALRRVVREERNAVTIPTKI
jgi:hypothetical protein